MCEFHYSFSKDTLECQLTIDFQVKTIAVYEDPWGRNSSSIPDFSCSFSEAKKGALINTNYGASLPKEVLEEVLFLTTYYENPTSFPSGERSFFFQTTSGFIRSKEKTNLIASVLLLSVAIILTVFNWRKWQQESFDQVEIRVSLFAAAVFFIAGIATWLYYSKRTRKKGFAVLGTTENLRILKEGGEEVYVWNDFTGNHSVYAKDKAFTLELKQQEHIYNKYGSRKIQKQLHFSGCDQPDFYLKCMLYRINLK